MHPEPGRGDEQEDDELLVLEGHGQFHVLWASVTCLSELYMCNGRKLLPSLLSWPSYWKPSVAHFTVRLKSVLSGCFLVSCLHSFSNLYAHLRNVPAYAVFPTV